MRFLFGVFIAIAFFGSALGYVADNFEVEYEDWRRAIGSPGIPSPPTTPDVCKKDILILLDTSYSIGQATFEKQVKPFLIDLVNSQKLNVAPDGTRLALIIFSNEKNTRKMFDFGMLDTIKDYEDYINLKLLWRVVSGDLTFTGSGLILANETFSQNNPLNYRSNIADVVLIITDGQPRGPKKINKELTKALKVSSELKGKDILIVGVAMGKEETRKKFNATLRQMVTSDSTLFNSDFVDLNKILDKLVDASCTPYKPGDCSCPLIQSQDVYIKPSQSTVDVHWVEPTLKCKSNSPPRYVTKTVTPDYKSPHGFGTGNHTIEYKYTFRGGFDLKCHVIIIVKSCTCPSRQTVVAYVSNDQDTAVARWLTPVPTCPGNLKSINPNTPSGSSFKLGKHTVNYLYSTVGGFDLTCGVDIDVQKCACQSFTESKTMQPDSSNNEMIVNWVVPKPNCAGQKIIRSRVQPNVSPGASFGVGRHTVQYSYDMSSGITVRCSATFDIKVVPCQGRDYDPAIKMCCCGKLQDKTPFEDCCGRKKYDTRTEKCCPVNFNIVPSKSPCPGGSTSV